MNFVTSNHWRRMNALLEQILAADGTERENLLEALGPEDRVLLPALRGLLAGTERPDAFMRRPVSVRVLDEIEAEARPDRPGVEVGPYRLLRELGVGGMGAVWLAERIDGTWQRKVAVKLPRSGWAPGVARRLEQERDTLAALEHPNIARLYDAGVTESGQPYIAMEYVDGEPIDEYIRSRALTIEQRLKLFLEVAGAVAYAHARLVVHRDLKPSNILVSRAGEVRLLDFGAAKLLGEEKPSALTRLVGQAMSPDYAAPEQIRNERITVATDVYSLGVVLYELLTGQRPYRIKRDSTAALEEAIERADVPLASSRVSGKLVRRLRGDLDTILATALQRDPARRYRSVEAFAADIGRHLAREPVLARPDSARYRIAKFVRRNMGAVVAAILVALAVGVGTGVALWQMRVARAEAARAERVKDFIASIFTHAVPRSGAGGVVTATDLLAAASERLEGELGSDPAVSAELAVLIADSLDLLGEPGRSEKLLSTAVQRAQVSLGRTHPVTMRGRLLLAMELKRRDLDGALRITDDLVPDAERNLPAGAAFLVAALEERAFILAKLNREQPSYATLRRSIEVGERYLGPLDPDTIWQIGLLSNTYARFGERDLQLTTATEAFTRAQRALGGQRPHNTLIAVERWYADALRTNSRPAEALPILERVLADQQKLDAAPTIRVRNAKLQLAMALLAAGRVEDALPALKEVAAMLASEQGGGVSDDDVAVGVSLAYALALAGYTDEALREFRRVDAVAQRLGSESARRRIGRDVRHAFALALHGSADEADRMAYAAADRAGASDGAEDRELRAQALLVAATNARLRARPQETLALVERIGQEPGARSLRPGLLAAIEAERGAALLDLGEDTRAAYALSRCRELFESAQIEPTIVASSCQLGSARLALRTHDPRAAREFLKPLLAAWASANPRAAGYEEVLRWNARAGGSREAF